MKQSANESSAAYGLSLYAPADSPRYDQEDDWLQEQSRHPHPLSSSPAYPNWRPARVPQVEYHPGPPYRSLPKLTVDSAFGPDRLVCSYRTRAR